MSVSRIEPKVNLGFFEIRTVGPLRPMPAGLTRYVRNGKGQNLAIRRDGRRLPADTGFVMAFLRIRSHADSGC